MDGRFARDAQIKRGRAIRTPYSSACSEIIQAPGNVVSHSAFKHLILRKGIQKRRGVRARRVLAALVAVMTAVSSQDLLADEGGVSVWLPGFFGSLAASPLQPGWSLTSIYYHTSVSAGADVSRAREITIGRIPVNLNANLDARADLALALPTYTFATPVFGAHDVHLSARQKPIVGRSRACHRRGGGGVLLAISSNS